MITNILLFILIIVILIKVLVRYKLKFDLVQSGTKYHLFLWFNNYDWYGDYKRTYLKLF